MKSYSNGFNAVDSSSSEERPSAGGKEIRTDGGSERRTVREERTLGPMRRTIADRLQESSRNAAHVTASREIDAEALLGEIETANQQAELEFTLVDSLLRALADTLAALHSTRRSKTAHTGSTRSRTSGSQPRSMPDWSRQYSLMSARSHSQPFTSSAGS